MGSGHRCRGAGSRWALLVMAVALTGGPMAAWAARPLPVGPREQQQGPIKCCVNDQCWTSVDGDCRLPGAKEPAAEQATPPQGSGALNAGFALPPDTNLEAILASMRALRGQESVRFVGVVEIVGKRTGWGPYLQQQAIVRTACMFKVVEAIKGSDKDGAFVTLGGELDGLTYAASHEPTCKRGDRHLVLLAAIGSDMYLASQGSSFHPLNSGVGWLDVRSAMLLYRMRNDRSFEP